MRKALIIALLMVLPGCALLDGLAKMSPKQKAIWMMATYTVEMSRLRAEATRYWDPDTSEAKRLVLRYRMTLLREVYPLIKAYVDSVENGGTPLPSKEVIVFEILNRIVEAVVGGVPSGIELADPPPRPEAEEDA